MRPRVRDDCLFLPVDDGVYVHTALASTRLDGGQVLHQVLDRLVPHLNGTVTVTELVSGLPEVHRHMVTQLVDMLVEHGIARDVDADLPHGLAPWELERYGQEIAFAEHIGVAAAAGFERFRLSRVLLVGAGTVMAAVVRTVLQLGLRSPVTLTTAELPTDTEGYARSLAEQRADDPLLELTTVDGSELSDMDGLVAGYDAVLHCSDRPMLGRAVRLARAARAAGIPALHALPVGGEVWVGPSGGGVPGGRVPGGCWECAWLRLRGAARADDEARVQLAFTDRPDAPDEPYLSGPLAGLVAATLGFAYFRLAAGGAVQMATGRRMTRVELETALVTEHRFTPHPACTASCESTVDSVGRRVAGLAGRAPVAPALLIEAAVDLVDPWLGLITELEEGDLVQLPLCVSAATVADPGELGTGTMSVTAVGPSRDVARARAVVAALEWAAGRLVTPSGPAWDLVAEAEVEAVPSGDGVHVAVAVGSSWAEAVGRALLRHRPIWAAAADEAAPPDPGAELPSDPLLDAAALCGAQLRGYLRTEPVPSVSIWDGPARLAESAALDLAVAQRTAVEAAAAAVYGHRVTGADVPPDLGDTAWADRLGPLVRQVSEAGWRVLVAPADECPTISGVLPFLAVVTVSR
jgi:bacteriocin biosynthesis cyclodehydratase domain-containing protein